MQRDLPWLPAVTLCYCALAPGLASWLVTVFAAVSTIIGLATDECSIWFNMVPKAGLEPARVSPLPPQDSVSTNSTTSARL